MKDCYKIQARPTACRKNEIRGTHYRITVLTDELVRMEYSPKGVFEDRATQMAWNRDFPEVEYTVKRTSEGILVRTSNIQMVYDENVFSGNGLSISLIGSKTAFHTTWHYGDEIRDLKGTARTLDGVNGAQVELGAGIVSREGFAVLDDSRGLAIGEHGWVVPREEGVKDIYFWGYGHDYKKALKDFYYLCGTTPMLPRFALGNWWSRYYRYTEKSYLELMDQFAKRAIPLSVAVIDMDWHLVDIDPKYGHGWTGFTWNRELFPDPDRFLADLHDRGMKVTLNLHPADGIRAYEEAYPVIAEHMGIDPETEEPVLFDVSDPVFLQHYYEDVIHPMEEKGVDFWWMDWQQGTSLKVKNMDPLWMLNHYGFLDSGRGEKRPLAFSRFSEAGSHRYPIGFSGDTVITWESLRFQPYFTATASNIGFGWWSHDIGGHMCGYKDNELMARWVQMGVFSPILRLHSSCSEFHGKEPWKYGAEAEKVMIDALRLRHRLIPYLYTMNYRNCYDSIPLILPLYYENPEREEAYRHRTEYYFGSELLVLPVTSARLPKLQMAKETIWFPEGIWFDIFTARVYRGNREMYLYRELNQIPVFAKAGAILPLTNDINGMGNPENLHICVYLGADGRFELYEDDNETCEYQNGKCVRTEMILQGKCDEKTSFTIYPAQGETGYIPERRSYVVEMAGACDLSGHCEILIDGEILTDTAQDYDARRHVYSFAVKDVPVSAMLQIRCDRCAVRHENPVVKDVFDLLDRIEIEYGVKEEVYRCVSGGQPLADIVAQLYTLDLDRELLGAVLEILTAL